MFSSAKLKNQALFGGLTEDQIEQILPLLKQEEFEKDQIIITEGDQNDRIRFILEGVVGISREGRKITELSEGNFFGEMEVIDIMPSAATVRALTPLKVMSISNIALHSIYKLDVHIFAMFVMNLARDISRRLRRMDEKMAESHPMDWN